MNKNGLTQKNQKSDRVLVIAGKQAVQAGVTVMSGKTGGLRNNAAHIQPLTTYSSITHMG